MGGRIRDRAGRLTAMNGVLLFGWSAAILFDVLRKTLDHLGMIEVASIK